MARVGHVRVDLYCLVSLLLRDKKKNETQATYTTVRPVCPTSLFRCLVDLDVLDNQVACVQTLRVRIRLGVLQQGEEKIGRLDWPSCARDTKLLAYEGPCASANKSPHREASATVSPDSVNLS
jgi:hypothetical protein